MDRAKLPPLSSIIGDLFTDRKAFGTLVAGAAALFAVGLDPRIWAPQLSTVQAAVRARPDLETVILVNGLLAATFLIAGGAVGDLSRVRPIVRGGLLVLLAGAILGLLPSDTIPFSLGRVASNIAGAFVFPVALASVALAYTGIARATAIGVAYGAFGAAQAVMPILLTLIPGVYLPGFIAEIVVVLVAIRLTWPRDFDLPRPERRERPYVLGTALWATGIVALTTGLFWIGGGWDNPVRLGIIALGVGLMAVFLVEERWRRRQQPETVRVERRPVTVALFVGVVIAIAQNVPMLQLPQYFSIVLGFGPLLGVVAVAPLFLALVVAGPVAGYLLARVSPRMLVGGGVVAVGLGNIVIAALIGPSSSYLGFVIPLVVVGAGFVIATSVRTAIIFASVPRGLPATAAALNEASIAVGNRVGILVSTAIVGVVAMSTLDASLVGVAPALAESQRAQFTELLGVLGTPAFTSVARAVQPADAAVYAEAYVAGIRAALLLGGVAAVVGGVVAWVFLGRRDPLVTIWEHRDEREETPTAAAEAPASGTG
jgi:MFS family permease